MLAKRYAIYGEHIIATNPFTREYRTDTRLYYRMYPTDLLAQKCFVSIPF